MAMKKAVINIPETISGMDVQTNGVHPIILVNALSALTKHFAAILQQMAKDAVGDNPDLQAQYLDRLTKKHLGGNPGDQILDPNRLN